VIREYTSRLYNTTIYTTIYNLINDGWEFIKFTNQVFYTYSVNQPYNSTHNVYSD